MHCSAVTGWRILSPLDYILLIHLWTPVFSTGRVTVSAQRRLNGGVSEVGDSYVPPRVRSVYQKNFGEFEVKER